MKRLIIHASIILAISCSAGSALRVFAAEKHSIGNVMKEAMKGETSLHKRVALGKGTDEDAAKLLAYFQSLPAEMPPEGDAASWKEKTEKLIAAAQSVVDKKPGATAQLQTAGNCKACHNVHKGS